LRRLPKAAFNHFEHSLATLHVDPN
jgi:hypothetical protein